MTKWTINVNELTLDNIGRWPNPIKYGLVFITVMLVFALGYRVLISPNIDDYNAVHVKEEKLKKEFEKLQEVASNRDDYRAQIVVMRERFGNMLKQLPTQNEMPGLLEDISRTGTGSGLTFVSFSPQPEIKHDFYLELPIQIEVIGSYHQLAVFLSRVAQLSRIVTLHDFVIEPVPVDKLKPVTASQGEQLSMSITATIYRYRTRHKETQS